MKTKIALLLTAILMALCASANEVQTVGIGTGVDKDTATMAALRNALENVYGVYLSSSTTMSDDRIISDDISAVSFGKIVNYKIIDTTNNAAGQYLITITANVSLDKLASFVSENTGPSVKFDGAGWGMQQKMKRLNKENEEKAAKDIAYAILSLDIDLSRPININKINHYPLETLPRYALYGCNTYPRTVTRDQCMGLSLIYAKKKNLNEKALLGMIDNAFKELKGPKNKEFRSEYTKQILYGLRHYVSMCSDAFAISDGVGHIYPIFSVPTHAYANSWFPEYNEAGLTYHTHSLKLGYNWTHNLKYADCMVYIFYVAEDLERVSDFTIIPLPQTIISRIKTYIIDKYIYGKSS